ncbi:DNA polymerase III subunit beta [Pleionea sp. CnH1-48]|uniref:DNA polymerase III subunit beta n=1 Tax=Pleionea sp. CnH1-48 TaxID=2954494 RepID=UPI0020972953|nr:DNA polymerase III subunit beta [Pleionea sp. CnH1-48]MCO7226623.1 DNA polymerase III subunit beta [Pleionea sp. CnH1-48]
MKLAISQDDLIGPLQLVSGAVERRQTLPVLSNILIQVDNGLLSLTGTDLEVEMVARIHLEGEYESGEITVPAKKFLDICKSLGSGTLIRLEQDENKVKLKTSKSRFTLSTLPASEFPNLEESAGLVDMQLSVAALKDLIDKTQFAMAQQDVRYYLNGMLFEFSRERLNSVATDGHRLALSSTQIESSFEDKNQAIVPRKGVLELARFLSTVGENIHLQLSSNHVRAISDHFTFTSKLVDGKYPDYEKVLPKGGDKLVVANREVLKEGMQKAAILCNEKFRGVRVNLDNGSLRINSNNPEQEEAEVEIEVDYIGPHLEIGFNVNYMLDVLNTVKSENVKLTFSDANSSLLMEEVDGSDSMYVIMPMRL